MSVTFSIEIDNKAAKKYLRDTPKQVSRAIETALDKTAYEIRDAVKGLIPKVFDNPVPYTRNSLKVQRTRNHNMMAEVWFKEPDRMGQHYLAAQVYGGDRKDKGFERALGARFMPSKHTKLNKSGNLTYGKIVQILSVLGKAEYVAGYAANMTKRSSKRNRKQRDFVLLRSRHGKLPPGIYERTQTGVGFGYKTKKTLPFGEYQKGRRKGRFASVVRARGLKPVMIQTRSRAAYKKRLPFYETANNVAHQKFAPIFFRAVNNLRRYAK